MPSKRRRVIRSRIVHLPLGLLEVMLGEPLPPGANRFLPYASISKWRERWERFGQQVLERWVETRPGTRPSRWWQYAAPAPRARAGAGNGAPLIESEAAYLRRLRLLLPGEEEALGKADFEPVVHQEQQPWQQQRAGS